MKLVVRNNSGNDKHVCVWKTPEGIEVEIAPALATSIQLRSGSLASWRVSSREAVMVELLTPPEAKA